MPSRCRRRLNDAASTTSPPSSCSQVELDVYVFVCVDVRVCCSASACARAWAEYMLKNVCDTQVHRPRYSLHIHTLQLFKSAKMPVSHSGHMHGDDIFHRNAADTTRYTCVAVEKKYRAHTFARQTDARAHFTSRHSIVYKWVRNYQRACRARLRQFAYGIICHFLNGPCDRAHGKNLLTNLSDGSDYACPLHERRFLCAKPNCVHSFVLSLVSAPHDGRYWCKKKTYFMYSIYLDGFGVFVFRILLAFVQSALAFFQMHRRSFRPMHWPFF